MRTINSTETVTVHLQVTGWRVRTYAITFQTFREAVERVRDVQSRYPRLFWVYTDHHIWHKVSDLTA